MARKPLDQDLYAAVVAEAKRKFDVWPSAYASGWVVKTYKARGGRYAGGDKKTRSGLTKWFGESWVDLSRPIREDGEVVGYEPCGRKKSGDPADYPKCRPAREAMRMTPAEVRDAIKRKRAAEAKAAKGGRGGRGARAPVRVATYKQNPAPVLYHGTTRAAVRKILKSGLRTTAGWGGAGTEGVYLSGSPAGALAWAMQSLLTKTGEGGDVSRFFRKHRLDELALLEVRIPEDELVNLKADMEQAEDVQYDGEEDDWQAALEQIGDVRFDKPIPAAWLRMLSAPELEAAAADLMPAQNPRREPYSDVEALAELASGGYGSFDDYYERWDTEDLDPEDLRYGRKVIWQVTPGRAIKIDPDYVVSMPENIFDPDKLAAIVDAVQSGEKPVFDVGYGTVRVIGERDVAESQEAFERGETLTQRPLDEGDIGKLLFTVRDGNHRVFGALIAGERHVWMHLSDNDVQNVREWRRDREGYLAKYGKWAAAQDARMQLFSDLLDEGDG